jgi:hypothetical protein
VPRSPNGDLDRLRVVRKEDLSGGKVELDRLRNVLAGFLFRFSRRGTTGQFRADRGIALGFWIELENDAKLHSFSVRP